MSKHTSGEWNVFESGSFFEVKSNNSIVAMVPFCTADSAEAFDLSKGEADANGRLIKAAPDLLKCLRSFVLNVKCINDDHFSGPQGRLVALANEAIAKAEGGNESSGG